MLALSRKKGDSVIIGDNIEVVILGISGDQVKIGFLAPKNVSVHRKEVYDQIKNQNKESVNTRADSLADINKLLKNS